MKTIIEKQTKTTQDAEVYIKLDSRNRLTIKSPTARIYAVEADESGIITLIPCRIEKQTR